MPYSLITAIDLSLRKREVLGYFMALNMLLAPLHALAETVKKNIEHVIKSENMQLAKQVDELALRGEFELGESLLQKNLHWPYSSEALPLLRAKAHLYQLKNNAVNAALSYAQILELAPNDAEALRGRAFACLKMGAPHLALTFAAQQRALFSEAEYLSFEQAAAGRAVRWGTLESKSGIGQQRFKATDKALQLNASVHLMHEEAHDELSESALYTQFDRLVAMRDRSQMQAVIDLYTTLKQKKVDIPAYAIAAVADAYLYSRQPTLARDLYLHALELSKNTHEYPNREWQLNLFNAYLDANEFDAAIHLIDRLVTEMPAVLNKGLRGVELDNEFYQQARINQVQARMFAERIQEAQELLQAMLESAPFALDTRLAQADLLQLREQPRAAQLQYVSVIVDDPSNSAAATGIAETAIILNDNKIAKQQLDNLLAHYPENLEVQRVEKLIKATNSPSLSINSGWSHSPGGAGNRGNRDWNVDAQLYSALFNENWRAFSHTYNAQADFDTTQSSRRRIGVGADYRSPSWQLSAELNQNQFELSDIGLTLNTRWLPNDNWQFNAALASDSNDIPLQAHDNNIKMHQFSLGMDYIANESRSIKTNVSHASFTDGNNRTEASLALKQRWASGPSYKLDTLVAASASQNSLKNAVYFNPEHDYEVGAQIINEWTLWRNYQGSFKHYLTLGAGQYKQQGFESGLTKQLRYEHEWNIDVARSINYGLAYDKHPYDGIQSKSTALFLSLNWHF